MESNVQQSGKYGINFGKGQGDIHIGDRIYQQYDPRNIRYIIREELWATEHSMEEKILNLVKTILREELRSLHKGYGTAVSVGLNALSELLKEPEVRDSMTAFRFVFQDARERIDGISRLKALHDLFHNIEILCYMPIVEAAKQFPHNDMAIDNLLQHHMNLQNEILSIQSIYQQLDYSITNAPWLLDLRNAERYLDEAIASLDSQKLRQATRKLHIVIAQIPSRINDRLIHTAGDLQLSKLIESLALIHEKLTTKALNSNKIQCFGKGIATLIDLNNRLAVLVVSHDYWQYLDVELRMIEKTLDLDLMHLEDAWPELKARVKPFFDEGQDEWTTLFQQDSQSLDTAMMEDNPAKTIRCFQRCRRRALKRFYQVDVTLKRLCEEIRKVGEHLTGVLEALG